MAALLRTLAPRLAPRCAMAVVPHIGASYPHRAVWSALASSQSSSLLAGFRHVSGGPPHSVAAPSPAPPASEPPMPAAPPTGAEVAQPGQTSGGGGGRGPLAWWNANKAKLKDLASKYGWLPVATYLGVYVVVLSGMFVLVKAGVVHGPDAEGISTFVNGWFVKRAVMGDAVVTIPAGFIDFATAWVLTKTTEPVRLVATIAVVPALARRLSPQLLMRFGAKIVEKV